MKCDLPSIRPTRRLHGRRLLVVEDNALNRVLMEDLLTNEGAIVSLASDGREGVEAVRNADPPYDAVLMDVQMPVMDGCTATRLMRDELKREHMPIIAMTANPLRTDRDPCIEAGMNEYLVKPVTLDELVEVLTRCWAAAPLQ